MATLKAMFILFDGYSTEIDKITKKTEQASNKILKANGIIDSLNSKLKATGASAGKASLGIGKIIKAFINLENIKKAMNISDEYINTNARLNLINDGLQTQAELQDKIFASAQRSKSAYFDMADAVSNMGLIAGDTFGSNDELIAFTELAQKSFKIDGASSSELPSYMNQLAEAMADGKIQGDEFESIMNKVPEIAGAISSYTGKSKTELTQETIGTDVMKNAMFAMSDDINEEFKSMPMTFANVWNKIKNYALRAFEPVIKKINNLFKSDNFNQSFDKIINGLYVLSNVASIALDKIAGIANCISNNWDKISPIIEGVTIAWLAYKGAMILVEAAQWALNIAMMENPIGLIIILLAILVGVIIYLWETSEGFRKFFANMWKLNLRVIAYAYNFFIRIYNTIANAHNLLLISVQIFAIVFGNIMFHLVDVVTLAVKAMILPISGFLDMLGTAIDVYNSIASRTGKKTIDIKIKHEDIYNEIDNAANKSKSLIAKSLVYFNSYIDGLKVEPLEYVNMDDYNSYVDVIGDKIQEFTLTGWIKDNIPTLIDTVTELVTSDDPITVKGTGSNGEIDVNMADEDLDQIRAIAERDYVANVATNSLAPNINIQFGEVHETADADKIAGRVKTILQQQIAMASEGVY